MDVHVWRENAGNLFNTCEHSRGAALPAVFTICHFPFAVIPFPHHLHFCFYIYVRSCRRACERNP